MRDCNCSAAENEGDKDGDREVDEAEKEGALIRAGIVYKSVNWQTANAMPATLKMYKNDPAMLAELEELLRVSNKNNKKAQTVGEVNPNAQPAKTTKKKEPKKSLQEFQQEAQEELRERLDKEADK